MSPHEVTVGRVARPHGVRGEVVVEVRTDEPERRFHAGAVLGLRAPRAPRATNPLPDRVSVTALRWHQDRLLLGLAGVADRDAAEALRGALLVVEVDPAARPDDPEEFYDHQLVGLAVHAHAVHAAHAAHADSAAHADGERVGVVTELLHSGAQDLLVVRRDDGREVMVPFVRELVPRVDLDAGVLVVADRPGLLDPEE